MDAEARVGIALESAAMDGEAGDGFVVHTSKLSTGIYANINGFAQPSHYSRGDREEYGSHVGQVPVALCRVAAVGLLSSRGGLLESRCWRTCDALTTALDVKP